MAIKIKKNAKSGMYRGKSRKPAPVEKVIPEIPNYTNIQLGSMLHVKYPDIDNG